MNKCKHKLRFPLPLPKAEGGHPVNRYTLNDRQNGGRGTFRPSKTFEKVIAKGHE
jgi:hypothetical protein